MDTSELYVKMCDCPEIKKAYWDLIDKGGKRRKERFDDFYVIRKSPDWILSVPDITSPSVTILNKDGKTAKRINLPTQDQIQEMLGDFLWTSVLMDRCFKGDYPSEWPMDTWEKRWLHLYMQEKHGKMWGGEKWEPEKEHE